MNVNDSQQRTDKQGPPWFPLYASDWLGDPELSACSLTAQGLLMRLMCSAWPTGGTVHLTRKGMHGLCASTAPAEVDRAFEELKDADRVSVVEEGKHLQVTITRLAVEAERANVMYSKRVDRATRAAEARWGACSKHAPSMQRACSSNAPDATVQYSTVQDKTETCLPRISNTIAADDEPETPTTSQPEVSEVEVNGLESLLTQSFSGWMDLLQKTSRPHKIIMATPSQRRWWFTLKDIGSQMIGQWPTTAQGARDGLQRLIDVVAAKPDVLKRYINAPHFLKSDWPQMVEAVTPVKVWTDHDEQLAKAAVAAMMERRDKICRLASQE